MIPTPTPLVNPSPESLDAFSRWSDNGPFAMLNLLRYAGQAGRQAYGRYGQIAAQSIAAVGGSLVYLGRVIDPVGSWDSVAVVHYPTPAAFLEMQNDPNYVAAIPDRTAGLDARLLYPFSLGDVSGGQAAALATAQDDEVVAIRLFCHHDARRASVDDHEPGDDSRIGQTILRLMSGSPGLVADGRWDELRLVRYDSADQWNADERARSAGDAASHETLSLLTAPGALQ